MLRNSLFAGALAIVALVGFGGCNGSTDVDHWAEGEYEIVLAALEGIASSQGTDDAVAGGFREPSTSEFQPDEVVARLARSVGFEICAEVTDCAIVLGRPRVDPDRKRAELSYTWSHKIISPARSVTIWNLELELQDREWEPATRTLVTQFESG